MTGSANVSKQLNADDLSFSLSAFSTASRPGIFAFDALGHDSFHRAVVRIQRSRRGCDSRVDRYANSRPPLPLFTSGPSTFPPVYTRADECFRLRRGIPLELIFFFPPAMRDVLFARCFRAPNYDFILFARIDVSSAGLESRLCRSSYFQTVHLLVPTDAGLFTAARFLV